VPWPSFKDPGTTGEPPTRNRKEKGKRIRSIVTQESQEQKGARSWATFLKGHDSCGDNKQAQPSFEKFRMMLAGESEVVQ
jgi:hypothetical protein